MNMLTIEVAGRAQADARFLRAIETGGSRASFVTFPDQTMLWRTLTPHRWALLESLLGAVSVSVAEAARRAGRDARRVREDVRVLVDAGILDRTPEGVVCPFDAVRVRFEGRHRA